MIILRSLNDDVYLVNISNIHALALPGVWGREEDIARLFTMNSPERQHDQAPSAPAPEHLKLTSASPPVLGGDSLNWYLHVLGYKEQLKLVKIPEALNEFMCVVC